VESRRPYAQARPRAFLEDWCRRSDGGPYPAYRDLLGRYQLDGLVLEILRVQPDPFAGPSRIRLLVPFASTALSPGEGAMPGGRGAAFPGLVDSPSARAVAVRDAINRQVAKWIASTGLGPQIDPPRQEVLDRSAVLLSHERVEIRLQCDLPARGRRILGREAARLLLQTPERLVAECLSETSLDQAALGRLVDQVEDFAFLQEELTRRDWVAFVADGSRLARRAGNDDRPLLDPVVPFESPAGLRQEVLLPHGGRITGMALPPGVTLLCGGGFHGKSTLLRAIGAATVPHIPGDGREWVAARTDLQSIRAEDGRAVTAVDLRPFIGDLPFARSTEDFTTANASGSTSQAAAILEAMQGGSRLLLMDEDTSATNFMIRDPLMERLLRPHQEPITPFLHRARTLYETLGLSSILVIGGSGEYFRVADRVLLLDTFRPHDCTAEARRLAEGSPPLPARAEGVADLQRATSRDRVLPLRSGPSPRIKAIEARRLLVEGVTLELDGLESLRDLSQARFLARVLSWRWKEPNAGAAGIDDRAHTVAGLEREFLDEWRARGLDGFEGDVRGDLAAVRFLDLLAAVNRLRASGRE
jgi:predicted ABC-class ATPase